MSEIEAFEPDGSRVVPLLTVDERLTAMDAKLDQLIGGVNIIGEMINQVYAGFGEMMQQVQTGGLSSLLGGMMGGRKNG